MIQQRICEIINLTEADNIRRMLNNETYLFIQLRDWMPNFTGDWAEKIDLTQKTLRDKRLPLSSPGSEIMACRVYLAIWNILPPIIMILGTVGNLLSFSVLCRRSMIQVSSYIYLAVLALVDEGILITGLFKRYIETKLGHRAEDWNSIVCKLAQVVGVSTSWFSVWLIVALTVERVIVISFPLQANRLATPRRARMAIGIIISFCVLTNLHFFETVDMVRIDNIGQNNSPNSSKARSSNRAEIYTCTFKPQYDGFRLFWTWLDAALYSYLPFGIITILNVIIVHGVYMAHKNRAGLIGASSAASAGSRMSRRTRGDNNNSSSTSSSSENTRQLTILLLVISFVFLLFTTPIVVVKFFAISFGESYNEDDIPIYTRATLQLIDCVAEMLMYCNHALNFFLYCAMGNKFRQQLQILCKRSRSTGERGVGKESAVEFSVAAAAAKKRRKNGAKHNSSLNNIEMSELTARNNGNYAIIGDN